MGSKRWWLQYRPQKRQRYTRRANTSTDIMQQRKVAPLARLSGEKQLAARSHAAHGARTTCPIHIKGAIQLRSCAALQAGRKQRLSVPCLVRPSSLDSITPTCARILLHAPSTLGRAAAWTSQTRAVREYLTRLQKGATLPHLPSSPLTASTRIPYRRKGQGIPHPPQYPGRMKILVRPIPDPPQYPGRMQILARPIRHNGLGHLHSYQHNARAHCR